MKSETGHHLGQELSGYVDGELTQQERQRVELHCQDCTICRTNLEELISLKQRVASGRLSITGEDNWRENMDKPEVQTPRSLGWILFIAGLLVAGGAFVVAFVTDDGTPIWAKLMFVAIYGGLAILLYSVLRQRLIEQKTDKFKDVEI